MAWVFAASLWIAGLVIGFAWGCRTGIERPAWARGFLLGFSSPFRWLVEAGKGDRR